MNLSEAQKGRFQLRKDLDILTFKFHYAADNTERRRLLTSMTLIMEELCKLYNWHKFIHS
ncbi:hypothetical protein [Mucilaginibacter lacusdianchii]|uniref:hypothetical protein n=1 Tax=Mucilaginibacter lacusdianchii TaxID=2684211 RepID=UPI00131D3C24|nr:hypothetical protein [Mucilaginibacter sp. JXJ CY 39]